MKKLKGLVAAALAATVLAVVGLARPEPAQAVACAEAHVLADYYYALGAVEYWNGDVWGWRYWNTEARLVVLGCS